MLVAFLSMVNGGAVRLHSAENLIQNPGFESKDGTAPWALNNWAKLNAKFSLDRKNPHRGGNCLKMEIVEIDKGANIQLTYRLGGKLKAGSVLKIGFWIRGADNTPPINATLSQNAAPWKNYFSAPIQITSSWKHHELHVSLKDNMDFKTICLTLFQETETTVWVDDFSAVIAPQKMSGVPIQGNRVLNHSFEVGREKWYFKVAPQGSWSINANESVRIRDQLPSQTRSEVVSIADAPHGDKVLHMKIIKGTRGLVNSAYFDLRYGHPTTLSFDIKTNAKWSNVFGSVSTSGEADRRTVIGEYFVCKKSDWQHHQFTFTPTPSPGNRYCFEFLFDTPGEYWIDNVRVNEGNKVACGPLKQANIGWETVGEEVPGHLYAKGDKVGLRVLVEGVPGTKSIRLMEKIIDVYDNVLGENQLEVQLKSNGKGERLLQLPTRKYGAFKYIVETVGAIATEEGPVMDGPAMEWQYQVLPQLPPLAKVSDHFFGGHCPLTPMALGVAEKVGLRSIRMHPPLNTKWAVVEPEPGQWDFKMAGKGLELAHTMGFNLLGSLDSTPQHRAALPTPLPPKTWMGYGNYPPKEWSAYEDYVKRSVVAYQDWITDWEVWNEPDNDFLAGPTIESIHGKTKEDLYFRIVQHTRDALDENNLEVNLVVGGVATLNAEFSRTIIQRNITQQADVFSFHMYGGTLSPSRLARVRQAQKNLNRKQQPAAVWHSEGAYFPTIVTWLRTPRILESLPDLTGHMVNKTVIRLVELKAAGIERSYHYPSPFDSFTGREIYSTRWSCGSDCAGNPLPIWAGHAACVRMLEGAKPDGHVVTQYPVGNADVSVARFLRGTTTIEVIWASSKVRLSEVASNVSALSFKGKRAFDIMSNAIKLKKDTLVSESPLYLIGR